MKVEPAVICRQPFNSTFFARPYRSTDSIKKLFFTICSLVQVERVDWSAFQIENWYRGQAWGWRYRQWSVGAQQGLLEHYIQSRSIASTSQRLHLQRVARELQGIEIVVGQGAEGVVRRSWVAVRGPRKDQKLAACTARKDRAHDP